MKKTGEIRLERRSLLTLCQLEKIERLLQEEKKKKKKKKKKREQEGIRAKLVSERENTHMPSFSEHRDHSIVMKKAKKKKYCLRNRRSSRQTEEEEGGQMIGGNVLYSFTFSGNIEKQPKRK